ncbi:RNA polymerase sigma factor [Ktedonosporobacter rubrisoli]|uniref:RNA polymerase sigma factor n=1 Tax=Ktedonosporobacter rubrisoli TaxID=2509675 RepID=A0A4P6JZR1_KTERU|nr:RNA polymerase sigma factor [Ktedonosporobacter rubrisoli]QBD81244.1 RNA polymerase sigma factor [Ktedonosporobacter rubrisoli]
MSLAHGSGTDGPADERILVIRAQRGNQRAFEILYERYNDRICRYLIRMIGNDGVGCELAQEAFIKAWKSILSLRDPARFGSWLYRIATNCAYNYHEHEKKRLRNVSWEEYEKEGKGPVAEGPERQVEESELMKQVLAQVSPTYRPCLILYVVERLPQRQIADLLGIKESSVSQYVSRGKEEFRRIYYRMSGKGQGK